MLSNLSQSAGVQSEEVKFAQGDAVPAIGFGTCELADEQCETAVKNALQAGYRQIDAVRSYENEAAIGRALRLSSVEREAIFLTTKVWTDDLVADRLRQSI